MQVLIPIVLIIFSLQSDNEVGQRIFPLELKENLKLSSFDISKTIRLNDQEYILIGKNKVSNVDTEGHRLLYLTKDSTSNRFLLKYTSKPKGEAYVYKPYFFKLENEIFIVVEEGYEFMSGVDLYRLKGDKIDFLGYVPVAGDGRNTIIEKMKLEKSGSAYIISFKGQVEYKAGTDNLIGGSRLFVRIDDDGLKIELDNKVQ